MLDATLAAAVPRLSLPVGALYPHVLADFLAKIYALGASDIKFSSTDYVWAEIARNWHPVTDRRLDHEEVITILTLLFNASGQSELGAGKPIDARAVSVLSRDNLLEFRLNATACFVGNTSAGVNITLRSMPKDIPSLERLGIEREIVDVLFPRYGLVLLVGTTGSGKSTFLAAAHRHRLVNRRHDPVHILTYEDPVEYRLRGLAQGHMPEPTQTEVGPGAQLKHMDLVGPNAMRRKGQVVQMGEIRDADSARAGFTLGATGHSTYATMHTETPARALSRTLQFFPPVEHTKVANDFMEQARLVVAQKLASRRDGRVIAFRSWLVFDRDVTRRIEQLPIDRWVMALRDITRERGTDFESRSMTALKDGLISFETFLEVASLTPTEGAQVCGKAGVAVDAATLDVQRAHVSLAPAPPQQDEVVAAASARATRPPPPPAPAPMRASKSLLSRFGPALQAAQAGGAALSAHVLDDECGALSPSRTAPTIRPVPGVDRPNWRLEDCAGRAMPSPLRRAHDRLLSGARPRSAQTPPPPPHEHDSTATDHPASVRA